jgi:hypothetical protein
MNTNKNKSPKPPKIINVPTQDPLMSPGNQVLTIPLTKDDRVILACPSCGYSPSALCLTQKTLKDLPPLPKTPDGLAAYKDTILQSNHPPITWLCSDCGTLLTLDKGKAKEPCTDEDYARLGVHNPLDLLEFIHFLMCDKVEVMEQMMTRTSALN